MDVHPYWFTGFHFLILEGGLLVILDGMIFFISHHSSCPSTARFWNSLLMECFPLMYDLNGFKSGINRHLLSVGSF